MLRVNVDPATATPLPPELARRVRLVRRSCGSVVEWQGQLEPSRWSAMRRFSPWVRRSDAWALIPVGLWVKITAVSTLLRFWPPGPLAAWLETRTVGQTSGSRAAGWRCWHDSLCWAGGIHLSDDRLDWAAAHDSCRDDCTRRDHSNLSTHAEADGRTTDLDQHSSSGGGPVCGSGHSNRLSRPTRAASTIVLLRWLLTAPDVNGIHERRYRNGDVYDWFRYDIVRIWEQPVEEVLAAGLPVLPLAPVANVEPEKVPEVLMAISERLVRETSPEQAATFWAATKVLMGLRYPKEQVEEFTRGVSAMILGIRGIEESSVYQDIFAQGRGQGAAMKGAMRARLRRRGRRLLRQGRKKLGPPERGNARRGSPRIGDLDRLNDLLDRIWTSRPGRASSTDGRGSIRASKGGDCPHGSAALEAVDDHGREIGGGDRGALGRRASCAAHLERPARSEPIDSISSRAGWSGSGLLYLAGLSACGRFLRADPAMPVRRRSGCSRRCGPTW